VVDPPVVETPLLDGLPPELAMPLDELVAPVPEL
jgi:hypothetical protein